MCVILLNLKWTKDFVWHKGSGINYGLEKWTHPTM